MLSWVEISRSALFNNIRSLATLSGQSELGIVVKGNAYGHGMVPISTLLESNKYVSWFCTAGIAEAITLRDQGITKKILAMSYTLDASAQSIIERDIDVVIDDLAVVNELAYYANNAGKKVNVHIKVDTGLARRGVELYKAFDLAKILIHMPSVTLKGVCTHLSDNAGKDPSSMKKELVLLDELLEHFVQEGIQVPYVHALASAGITTIPAQCLQRTEKRNYIMRIGSHAYGLWKSPEQKDATLCLNARFSLESVLSWKSRIVDIVARKGQRLALIPIRFDQGYPYSLIGKSYIELQGGLAPLIDSLDRSFLVADVTHIPHLENGKTVTLIGNRAGIDIYTVAGLVDKTVNEFLVGIHPDIPRIIVT